jgi:hypothetical protein
MTKYDIEWSISDKGWSITGTTTIEAEDKDEAMAKFELLSPRDLIDAVTDTARDSDAVELIEGPTSDEDRERRKAKWREFLQAR